MLIQTGENIEIVSFFRTWVPFLLYSGYVLDIFVIVQRRSNGKQTDLDQQNVEKLSTIQLYFENVILYPILYPFCVILYPNNWTFHKNNISP